MAVCTNKVTTGGTQTGHKKHNISKCYKLHVTNLEGVCGHSGQEGWRIKRPIYDLPCLVTTPSSSKVLISASLKPISRKTTSVESPNAGAALPSSRTQF